MKKPVYLIDVSSAFVKTTDYGIYANCKGYVLGPEGKFYALGKDAFYDLDKAKVKYKEMIDKLISETEEKLLSLKKSLSAVDKFE